MYELHHAELELAGDIPCKEYRYKIGIIAEVENILGKNSLSVKGARVYLLAIEMNGSHDGPIFIDDNINRIKSYLTNSLNKIYSGIKVFLQEYESYEAAYEVALSMKEVNSLCYDEKEPPIGRLDVLPINVN